MSKQKQGRKGRPIYLINFNVEPLHAEDWKFNFDENTNIQTLQLSSFPIACTNLKKAYLILKELSGNVQMNSKTIEYQLPTYEKIRSDINFRDDHSFKVFVTLENKDTVSDELRERMVYPLIHHFLKVILKIERKYLV